MKKIIKIQNYYPRYAKIRFVNPKKSQILIKIIPTNLVSFLNIWSKMDLKEHETPREHEGHPLIVKRAIFIILHFRQPAT